MKRYIKLFIIIFTILLFCCFTYFAYDYVKSHRNVYNQGNSEFTFNIIKNVGSKYNSNYLISPYSIEVALSMLQEGATGETKSQINNVVSPRTLKINNSSVKVANALFIKDKYKSYIKRSFMNTLNNKYKSEILYDEFSTPLVINNWVNDKTKGMIKEVIDRIPSDFVLGLANAIAIDVKWVYQFECDNTVSEVFYKENNEKINVSMMHGYYQGGVSYLDGDVKGIMLPYDEGLSFVALLPNESLKSFTSTLDKNKVGKILNSFKESSSSKRVNLSLPKFKYDFDLKDFKNILVSMGIKDAFDPLTASFDEIITKDNSSKAGINNIYVSDAIHKTYIDLNETGTKAAAVTYFGLKDSSMVMEEDYDEINIKFDKPFIYMIKDDKTNEILFFGSVYEPSKWNGSSCDE